MIARLEPGRDSPADDTQQIVAMQVTIEDCLEATVRITSLKPVQEDRLM